MKLGKKTHMVLSLPYSIMRLTYQAAKTNSHFPVEDIFTFPKKINLIEIESALHLS